MSQTLKRLLLAVFIITFLFTSCRKEDTELIQGPEDQVLVANSVLANLMQQTVMNDGSVDNIIDRANCFNIKLPLTVKANGVQIVINSEDDLKDVEFVFDTSDDDIDELEINFPVTIVFNDFKEVVVENIDQLYSYSNECNGENESDLDIECLDFQYPIKASLFNSANELIDVINLVNDYQLYDFLENIDQNDIVNIKFPIKVKLYDDTEITLNNLDELKTLIESYYNACDEDDDYDYSDDDCDQCTKDELKLFLTSCNNWIVDKLERNDYDYDNVYEGYEFNFLEDGTISVYWSGYEAYGTWTTNGSGNDLTVVINIPDLPYCNNNWILHEIQSYSGETRVDFRVDNVDRLRYVNTCN
jgi:hypothetical protein